MDGSLINQDRKSEDLPPSFLSTRQQSGKNLRGCGRIWENVEESEMDVKRITWMKSLLTQPPSLPPSNLRPKPSFWPTRRSTTLSSSTKPDSRWMLRQMLRSASPTSPMDSTVTKSASAINSSSGFRSSASPPLTGTTVTYLESSLWNPESWLCWRRLPSRDIMASSLPHYTSNRRSDSIIRILATRC